MKIFFILEKNEIDTNFVFIKGKIKKGNKILDFSIVYCKNNPSLFAGKENNKMVIPPSYCKANVRNLYEIFSWLKNNFDEI